MNKSLQIVGSIASVGFPALFVGTYGGQYPYGNATVPSKMAGATDYRPLTPQNDTCTPPSSGNYTLVCNHACVISSSFNLSIISLNGTGSVNFANLSANFTKYDTTQATACSIMWKNSTIKNKG